jgi:hypothetical protein
MNGMGYSFAGWSSVIGKIIVKEIVMEDGGRSQEVLILRLIITA